MTRAWAHRWAGRLWPVVALMLVWALFFWRFAAPDERDRLAYEAETFTEQPTDVAGTSRLPNRTTS